MLMLTMISYHCSLIPFLLSLRRGSTSGKTGDRTFPAPSHWSDSSDDWATDDHLGITRLMPWLGREPIIATVLRALKTAAEAFVKVRLFSPFLTWLEAPWGQQSPQKPIKIGIENLVLCKRKNEDIAYQNGHKIKKKSCKDMPVL